MTKKKIILFSTITIFIALVVLLIILLLSGKSVGVVNVVDESTGLTVDENFQLFSVEDAGYSFLYPNGRLVNWNCVDGAYIYCGESYKTPYVLISRTNKSGMNPEKYFKDCDKLILGTFTNVQSTKIQEVPIGNKTLYFVRYVADGLVIDRYVEIYKQFYVQYTSISEEEGSLNTELYYAISTLHVNNGAYVGTFSESVSTHYHEDFDMQVDIPDMLETKDLTIGYFASSDNAIMLAVLITEDDYGTKIYNRQDFIDKAASSSNFVPNILDADSATFEEGKELSINGRNFYCYPMKMSEGEETFSGVLCLSNADETGCWLVCYAVNDNYTEYEKTIAMLADCAESFSVE